MEDEYEGIDEDDEDIKWRKPRPEGTSSKFLSLIFEDPDWYDGLLTSVGTQIPTSKRCVIALVRQRKKLRDTTLRG